MDPVQAISLTIVLILALCGCMYLLERVSARLLRPRDSRLVLLLPLEGSMPNVEQHVRAAQDIAYRLRIPLYAVDRGMDEESLHIAAVLLRNGVGELIDEASLEKLA